MVEALALDPSKIGGQPDFPKRLPLAESAVHMAAGIPVEPSKNPHDRLYSAS